MYRGDTMHIGPTAEPLGRLGGFSVTYSNVDPMTLRALRHYQRALRTDYPGWMSRMEFNSAHHGLTVHVFPATEIPLVALNHFSPHGCW
jgi:hypothetical protein